MKIFNRHMRTALICFLLASAVAVAPGSAVTSSASVPTGKADKVKNVIVMIADGWGYSHVNAASYYESGEAGVQVYEDFPTAMAMSTYMFGGKYEPVQAWSDFNYVKSGVTDSAAAATAMSTGTKTYNGAIGVGINKNRLKNVIERAEERGKATGVVTTVPFSHATPAGFVVHNVNRSNYQAIAREMVLESAVDVIMGSGNPWYNNDGQLRATPNTYQYVGGKATWDALVEGTVGNDANGDAVNDPWHLVQTRSEFQGLIHGPTPGRVIGVPQVFTTTQQERSGNRFAAPYVVPLNTGTPSLEEMTRAAINILDNDPDGLFLMVEGGAVDWASHANQSGRVIEEQIDFNHAVEAVVDWVKHNSNWGETLLIVTGDHETGYLLGPNSNPMWQPLENNGAGNLPGMTWYSTSHTNSLIPFFAKGSYARFFKAYTSGYDPVRGNYIDNTEIGKVVFKSMDDPADYDADDAGEGAEDDDHSKDAEDNAKRNSKDKRNR